MAFQKLSPTCGSVNIKINMMETKKEMTSAEKTLSSMATVVLVLGIIGSIATIFSSCISWDISEYSGSINGMDGINWLGLPTLIYIVMATLIGWSVLSVVAEMSVNIRLGRVGKDDNWRKEFAMLIATDQKLRAKELLYRVILQSSEFSKVLEGGRDEYHAACVKEVNGTYSVYLKAIDEDGFKISETDKIFDVFR